MNITKLRPYLLHQYTSESELIKHIEKLSQNFTSQRSNLGEYLNDEKLISAYTCFYLTTNYPKFSHVINHLQKHAEDFKDHEWVDIGCGPGTFLFAIKDFYAGALKKPLWGIESSKLMRQQAEAIEQGLYSHSKISIVDSAKKIPRKKDKRIVLFSHSLNEMGNDNAMAYLKELNPDKVLIIEPGTKDFFKQYLSFRERLISLDFNCLYPCPSNNLCPLSDLNDWCHQYIKVKHDPEIERLTQLSTKNRKWLPLTIGLYAKDQFNKWQNHDARLIRTYPSTKFSFEWDVCRLSDNINQTQHFQLMKRHMSKQFLKQLDEILAGAQIKFELDKNLSDNKARITLRDSNE